MDNILEKNLELANLIFPNITNTIEDLEKRYPKRDLQKGAMVTRFAPSPTGFLHTGALFTSLINKRIATQSGGVFYLRVEDTDKKREVLGSTDIFAMQMKEFDVSPDEGIISSTEEFGKYGPYMQSKREEIYKTCAKHLITKGLAYPCFCTPEQLELIHNSQEKNKQRTGYYSSFARCRNYSVDETIEKIKANIPYVLRFRSSGSHLKKISFVDAIKGKLDIAQNDQDIVIIKSDGLPTYHFAHVVDDHFMRTTHVIRGEEWIPSTPIHIELFDKMEFEVPTYAHVPSIMILDGTSKRKLSKRKDIEAAVSYFEEAGYLKEALIEYILTIINSDYEPWRTKNPLANNLEFKVRLEKINSSGALFDILKLNDISKELIAKFDSQKLLDNVLEWSKKYDNELYEILIKDLNYSKNMFAIERDGAKKIRKDIAKFSDIKSNFFYFFDELYNADIKESGYNFEIGKDTVKKIIEEYIKIYNHNDSKEEWFERMKELANNLGFCINMKEYKLNSEKYEGCISDFAGIIRLAITNRKNTPDIYSIMQTLGEAKVLERLNLVLTII